MVNKKLHLNPVEDRAYMDTAKYLNDVRILYKSGDSQDQEALENELTQGF